MACVQLSTEDGLVTCYDGRMTGSASIFTLQAHDEATCSLDFNPRIPHCLVTCSFDKTAKIWDVLDQRPSLVHTRDMGMGKLFAASFCPDVPYSVAVAGGKGKVDVWNTSNLTAVRKRFDSRLLDDVPPAVRVRGGAARICDGRFLTMMRSEALCRRWCDWVQPSATAVLDLNAVASAAASSASDAGAASEAKKNKNKKKKKKSNK